MRSTLRHIAAVFALLFGAAVLPSAPRAALSAPPANTPEGILFNSANRDRAAAGLPAFQWDANLADAARFHESRQRRDVHRLFE